MHADGPAVRAAAQIHRLHNIDRLGDGAAPRGAYAGYTEPPMRTTVLHTLTLLTLVGAALCALWLAAVDPVDALPVSAATAR